MEPDRFQHNPKVYIIGLLSMIASMALFGLGAYTLPNIAFGLSYRIPEIIYNWISWVHIAYDVTEKKAGWMVLIIIFILGLASSLVTYSISNRIETEMYAIKPEKEQAHAESNTWRETAPFVFKMLFILASVFIGAKLFHWVITIE